MSVDYSSVLEGKGVERERGGDRDGGGKGKEEDRSEDDSTCRLWTVRKDLKSQR